jgi:TPR repeat protein
MLNRRTVTRVIALVVPIGLASSCSTTPGDAAFRSGHYVQAAELYKTRAAAGDSLAAYKLATMYDGVNWTRAELGRDEATALIYYKRAFELGHITAPSYIGYIYEVGGQNVGVDYNLARQWYERGAKLGQHSSMYALAGLYSKDLLQPKDDRTGLMWAEVARQMAAAHQQNAGTQFILDDRFGYWSTLKKRMSESDIATATAQARDFIRSYKAPSNGELDPRDWTL